MWKFNHQNTTNYEDRDLEGLLSPESSFASEQFKTQLAVKLTQPSRNSFGGIMNYRFRIVVSLVLIVIILSGAYILTTGKTGVGELLTGEKLIAQVLEQNKNFLINGENNLSPQAGNNYVKLDMQVNKGPRYDECRDYTYTFHAEGYTGAPQAEPYFKTSFLVAGSDYPNYRLIADLTVYSYLGGKYAVGYKYDNRELTQNKATNALTLSAYRDGPSWNSVYGENYQVIAEDDNTLTLGWTNLVWECFPASSMNLPLTKDREYPAQSFTVTFDKHTYRPSLLQHFIGSVKPENLVAQTEYDIQESSISFDEAKQLFDLKHDYPNIEVKYVEKFTPSTQGALDKSYRILSKMLTAQRAVLLVPVSANLKYSLTDNQIGTITTLGDNSSLDLADILGNGLTGLVPDPEEDVIVNNSDYNPNFGTDQLLELFGGTTTQEPPSFGYNLKSVDPQVSYYKLQLWNSDVKNVQTLISGLTKPTTDFNITIDSAQVATKLSKHKRAVPAECVNSDSDYCKLRRDWTDADIAFSYKGFTYLISISYQKAGEDTIWSKLSFEFTSQETSSFAGLAKALEFIQNK